MAIGDISDDLNLPSVPTCISNLCPCLGTSGNCSASANAAQCPYAEACISRELACIRYCRITAKRIATQSHVCKFVLIVKLETSSRAAINLMVESRQDAPGTSPVPFGFGPHPATQAPHPLLSTFQNAVPQSKGTRLRLETFEHNNRLVCGWDVWR